MSRFDVEHITFFGFVLLFLHAVATLALFASPVSRRPLPPTGRSGCAAPGSVHVLTAGTSTVRRGQVRGREDGVLPVLSFEVVKTATEIVKNGWKTRASN